jgi:hypothetical protein
MSFVLLEILFNDFSQSLLSLFVKIWTSEVRFTANNKQQSNKQQTTNNKATNKQQTTNKATNNKQQHNPNNKTKLNLKNKIKN